MKISRRTMLATGAAAIAIPGAAIVATRGFGSQQDIVIAYLRRALPGLAVPDADMRRFAGDFLAKQGETKGAGEQVRRQALLMAMNSARGEALLPAHYRSSFEGAARGLVTEFLTSTDFFGAAGRDPARTRYVGFADPYAVGCRNPLARFDLA